MALPVLGDTQTDCGFSELLAVRFFFKEA